METTDRVITYAEARKKVASKPGHYKAAVVEGKPALRDNPDNDTVLFRLIKTAEEYFKERVKAHDDLAKRKFGSLSVGVVLYKDGHCIGLDRGRSK